MAGLKSVLTGLVIFLTVSGARCEEKFEIPLKNLTAVSDEVRNANSKDADWTAGIGDWDAPADMSKNCRYFHLGYDHSSRPVMVWEGGRCDVKKWTSAPETRAQFYKFMEQFWYRLQHLKPKAADAAEGVVLILDMGEFPASQLQSLETIKAHLKFMITGEKFENNIVDCFIINLNFIGQTWVNLVRPIAGKLIGKSESFGPKRETWLPVLTSKIPKDQIPTWFGGSDDYKPVQVWG